MPVPARKYNPGFLSDDELIDSFCVRTVEYNSIVEELRECRGKANIHQIVIGPRGSGKTSLLLRVAAQIRRDADLSSRLFPVIFAEESYEVASAGEFWLECLARLADQAPSGTSGPDLRRSYNELRKIPDNKALGDRCLGVLQDYSDREAKRLVLIVENLNMMFDEMPDKEQGWRLRHTLQNEHRIILLASATSRFDEIDNQDRALYDLFRTLQLHPLNVDECAKLWQTVSGQHRAPETIRALRTLTGGSPRILTIVARFGAKLSFGELLNDLLDLVDDHTEYFKSHLDALPPQERRVYLALADLWKPATAREIAERTRLDTSKCSAQLVRLTGRGIVDVTGGSPRRKLYYLAERLYNIYYLMRRSRGPGPLIEALVHFMEVFYSPFELRDIGVSIANNVEDMDTQTQSVFRAAFEHLVSLPSLEAHREELLSLAPEIFLGPLAGYRDEPAAPSDATSFLDAAEALASEGKLSEALAAWEEITQRFGVSETSVQPECIAAALFMAGKALAELGRPEEALAKWNEAIKGFDAGETAKFPETVSAALFTSGVLLRQMNRQEEALVAWHEIAQRFGASKAPALLERVAGALVNSGSALAELSRPEEALEMWSEVTKRFSAGETAEFPEAVSMALFNSGLTLCKLNRPEKALAAWHELVQRFGASEDPELLEQVADALVKSGSLLAEIGRFEEALEMWSEVTRRFGADHTSEFPEAVSMALSNSGALRHQMNRLEEALDAWHEIVQRFGASEDPALLERVADALVNSGGALARLGRPEEALEMWSEVTRRFGAGDTTEFPETVSAALFNRGLTLCKLNRPEEALAAWQEVVQRFGASEDPALLELVANALLNSGRALFALGRREEALEMWNEVTGRFSASEDPALHESVAYALLDSGSAFAGLGRPKEALKVWGEVVQRFGTNDASALLEPVAKALLRSGSALAGLEFFHEALKRWGEVIGRFGASETPALLEPVAGALVGSGSALVGLGKPEEAMKMWDEAIRRFGAGGTVEFPGTVSMALFNKGVALRDLNRQEEALEVWNEIVQRFGASVDPALHEHVARALLCSGGTLAESGRTEEALAMFNDVNRRFSSSIAPKLRSANALALLETAEIELTLGRSRAAIDLVDEALMGGECAEFSEKLCRGHLIRAQANLNQGNNATGEKYIQVVLENLPKLDSLPKKAIRALSELAFSLGPLQMRDLIQASSSANLLLPLTTAIELELGLESRVPKEVEEIAEDVREEWMRSFLDDMRDNPGSVS